jgi:hypothetical protein
MPLNECTVCGEDFASLAAFDQHTLSASSDPTFDCMTVAELQRQGWTRNRQGRWTSPKLAAKAEQLAEHHRKAPTSLNVAA